jgi:hypothetical protein
MGVQLIQAAMVFSEGIVGVMGNCILHIYLKLNINKEEKLKIV